MEEKWSLSSNLSSALPCHDHDVGRIRARDDRFEFGNGHVVQQLAIVRFADAMGLGDHVNHHHLQVKRRLIVKHFQMDQREQFLPFVCSTGRLWIWSRHSGPSGEDEAIHPSDWMTVPLSPWNVSWTSPWIPSSDPNALYSCYGSCFDSGFGCVSSSSSCSSSPLVFGPPLPGDPFLVSSCTCRTFLCLTRQQMLNLSKRWWTSNQWAYWVFWKSLYTLWLTLAWGRAR